MKEGTEAIYFDSNHSTEVISFSTNREWKAGCNVSWLSLSQHEGPAGDIELIIVAIDNPYYNSRNAVITITAETLVLQYEIIQDERRELVLDNKNFEVGSDGGNIRVPIQSNVEYSYEILGEAKDWIEITNAQTKGLKDYTMILSVKPNQDYDGRVGQVRITGAGKESFITVTQSQLDELIVGQSEFAIGSDGGNIRVPIQSNVEYSYEILGEAKDWIEITNAQTKGLKDYTMILSIKPNQDYDGRVGQVRITGAGKESFITVTQYQFDDIILDKEEYIIENKGGMLAIHVMSNVDYSVEIDDSAEDWIHRIETRALVDSKLHLFIDENKAYKERDAVIRLQKADSDFNKTFTIKQKQRDTLAISHHKDSLSYGSGIAKLQITTNCDYGIKIPDDARWIRASRFVELSKNDGVTVLEYTFSIDENEAIVSRSAICSIYSADGSLSFDYEISQEAQPIIQFADQNVKNALLARFDDNKDGEISYMEARNVNSFDSVFADYTDKITSFDEFELFTNVMTMRGTFNGCTKLKSVKLPKNLIELGDDSFNSCIALEKIDLPNSLVYIGSKAFYGCSKMTGTLNLPSSLMGIGERAFAMCFGLTGDLKIPDSVTHIGGYAFQGCSGFDGRLILPNNEYLILNEYSLSSCPNFTGDLFISSNVRLSNYVFSQSGFTGNVYVNACGFYSYSKVKIGGNLIIGDNLEYIYHSFRDVDVEGYIYIGKKVNQLSSQAFYGIRCDTIYCAAIIPPICDDDLSISLYGKTLYVPVGRKEIYSTSQYWKDAKEIIETDFSELQLKPEIQ